jgi:DNA-binding CsgD family transcriptional regulator
MESTDELIHGLYATAMNGEWRDFRGQALARICDGLGANSAAWWTRGGVHDSGELTQHPQPYVTTDALGALPFKGTSLLELPARGSSVSLAYQGAHKDSAIVSTVLLSFPKERKPSSPDNMRRVLTHMVEAGALSIVQFIRRDDWLASMGRTNRGAAAMVDAEGSLFAASERFREMINGAAAVGRLPFDLPESVLGPEGGDFVQGPLHVRVKRLGALYLLYARKPLPLDSLSPREQEIARALGSGKTLKSIARQYDIAVSTVANHTTRIYRKLAIYRREDLIDLVRMKPQPATKKNGAD